MRHLIADAIYLKDLAAIATAHPGCAYTRAGNASKPSVVGPGSLAVIRADLFEPEQSQAVAVDDFLDLV